MEEIVTIEQAEHLLRILAFGTLPVGFILGVLVGALRHRLRVGLLLGLLCGLIGPAIWALWRLYNGVIGIYGLDSVRGLLINLALFVGIGVAAGIAIGLVWRRVWRGGGETASTTTE